MPTPKDVERQRNRERMPEVAKLLDDAREHLGMPAYFHLTENGYEVEWLNPDYEYDLSSGFHVLKRKDGT
jgi:hypothetical protein